MTAGATARGRKAKEPAAKAKAEAEKAQEAAGAVSEPAATAKVGVKEATNETLATAKAEAEKAVNAAPTTANVDSKDAHNAVDAAINDRLAKAKAKEKSYMCIEPCFAGGKRWSTGEVRVSAEELAPQLWQPL